MPYPNLTKPGKIGSLELKNRMVRSAAGTESAKDNHVTPEIMALYTAWARGGASLVVVEGIFSSYNLDVYPPSSMRLDSDEYLPEMSKLYAAIHENGAKTIQQVMHLGTWNLMPGSIPISASDLTEEENPPMEQPFPPTVPPRGVTKDEIKAIIADFVAIAQRVQKAGADGVEINAAGAHFLDSFLSRVWNKRHDEYGVDSCENRSRIVCEIISEIKKACGDDFVVTVLFNGVESGIGEKGTTLEESIEFAKFFEAAGADALQVRNYGYGENTARQWIENTVYPEPVDDMPKALDWSRDGAGAYIPLARAIKQAVSIPVAVVGRMDPDLGEAAIAAGDIDYCVMQRRLIADPDLPNKVIFGRTEDIKPCTACLYCASSPGTGRLLCRVNPRVGLPDDFAIVPAEKVKNVAVVGAGPGGLEAARVAAERGHKVTLFEKGSKIGGLLPMASIVKGTRTENLYELVAYYETQIKKLGINLRTRTEFKPNMARDFDAVIVAVGGVDTPFNIPGTDKKIFVSNEKLHGMLSKLLGVFNPERLRKLTKLYMPLGKRVAIIGGDITGAELAEFLIMRNHPVTIVTELDPMEVGKGMAMIKGVYLKMWLAKKGCKIVGNIKEYKEVTDKGLVVINSEGKEELIEADSVCTALPLSPNTALYDAIKAAGTAEVYNVGDSESGDGLIVGAIFQGYDVARKL